MIENGRPIGLGDAGRYWHSDLSYKSEPSLGSLLHAQELPATGGDTLFANQYLAFEALPADLKRRIAGRRAVHDYRFRYADQAEKSAWRPPLSAGQIAEVPEVIHPVVRTHPETGRQALFISEGFTPRIVDLAPSESDGLLAALFDHQTRPEFLYRHRWQAHDLLFWDNRATIHHAPGFSPDHRRTLYRTTVQGDVPV